MIFFLHKNINTVRLEFLFVPRQRAPYCLLPIPTFTFIIFRQSDHLSVMYVCRVCLQNVVFLPFGCFVNHFTTAGLPPASSRDRPHPSPDPPTDPLPTHAKPRPEAGFFLRPRPSPHLRRGARRLAQQLAASSQESIIKALRRDHPPRPRTSPSSFVSSHGFGGGGVGHSRCPFSNLPISLLLLLAGPPGLDGKVSTHQRW